MEVLKTVVASRSRFIRFSSHKQSVFKIIYDTDVTNEVDVDRPKVRIAHWSLDIFVFHDTEWRKLACIEEVGIPPMEDIIIETSLYHQGASSVASRADFIFLKAQEHIEMLYINK